MRADTQLTARNPLLLGRFRVTAADLGHLPRSYVVRIETMCPVCATAVFALLEKPERSLKYAAKSARVFISRHEATTLRTVSDPLCIQCRPQVDY